MSTHYYAVLFHENLFNEANDEERFRKTFDLFDNLPITRKPSLAEIHDAILQHVDGYQILRDHMSDTQLDFYMEKRDQRMLDYVEWTISQADLDTGILSLGRAYSERYPATLATLAEQIGPIGYFNVSTMALGIIEGTANLAQALAIANGTEGVDVITCTDFSELFRELCRHYLEQDDPDHPVCTCYLPGGTLYLRKKEKGISLVVGGFIWPVSLMRDATDQERNAMLLNVLTNFNFQQDGENQWRAVLAPAMTRHFVEKAFSQLPFDTRASSQFAIVLSPAGHYTPA